MEWLILTESQEKAQSFTQALPKTLCLSTRGMLWEPEIELSEEKIYYKKKLKKDAEHTLRKIRTQAEKCDRVLLAFEQTRLGEAVAFELQETLGREKCCRWTQNNLERGTIQRFLAQMETLPAPQMTKCRENTAKSYWCQSTLDITWTGKITRWLKTKHNILEKTTRTQMAILNSIFEETTKRENYKKQKYYEIQLTLTSKSRKTLLAAPVNPPERILDSLPPSAKKFWKAKKTQALVDSPKGFGLAQPNYPEPWRFQNREEAQKYRNHLEKFPYFLVDTVWEEETNKTKPPFIHNTLLAHAVSAGHTNQMANQRALVELYLEGYITYPRSDNPNLWETSFQKLQEYARRRGVTVRDTLRRFEPEFKTKRQEALRPCNWDKTPKELAVLLPETDIKETKLWMYQEIWKRSLASQQIQPQENREIVHLSGPLPISKKTATKNKDGLKTKREKRFDAPLSLCLRADSSLQGFREKEALEVTGFQILEKETTPPQIPTKEELLLALYTEGKMKPETLENSFENLLQRDLIQTTPHLRITDRGRTLHSEINRVAGLFLEKEFHREIHSRLEHIENGEEDASEFLQEWWYKLQTLLS
jgi:DNA topoisomerase IA